MTISRSAGWRDRKNNRVKRVKPTVSIVFLSLTSRKQHLKHKSLLFIKPYMF